MAKLTAAAGRNCRLLHSCRHEVKKTAQNWQARASKACSQQSASARQASAPKASLTFKTYQQELGIEAQSPRLGRGVLQSNHDNE